MSTHSVVTAWCYVGAIEEMICVVCVSVTEGE